MFQPQADWYDRLQLAIKHVSDRRTVYLMGSVIAISGYAVSKISYNVMAFFSSLDFYWVAKISYLSGLLTAAAMGAVSVACMRLYVVQRSCHVISRTF